jgi:hypothetical protein
MKSVWSIFILAVIAVAMVQPAAAQNSIKFQQPILITSAGQSADVTMAGQLCKRLKLDYTADNKATAKKLDGVKTLIIVPGFSSKGLGAAGISREQEMARVKELIDAAKSKKLNILVLHLGGKPRRGAQSDDFNKMAAEAAAHMVVVQQGDEDQFFSTIAKEKKVGIDLVDKIAAAMKPLETLFN